MEHFFFSKKVCGEENLGGESNIHLLYLSEEETRRFNRGPEIVNRKGGVYIYIFNLFKLKKKCLYHWWDLTAHTRRTGGRGWGGGKDSILQMQYSGFLSLSSFTSPTGFSPIHSLRFGLRGFYCVLLALSFPFALANTCDPLTLTFLRSLQLSATINTVHLNHNVSYLWESTTRL